MKNSALPVLRPLIAAAFALICVAPPLRSQDSGAPAAPPPSSATVTKTPNGAPEIDIDFSGGTIADLTAVLQKSDAVFNLIALPECLQLTVPAFSLRNTDPETFGVVLNELLAPQRLNVFLTHVSSTRAVLVLRKTTVGGLTITRTFQISDYLKSQSIDDIVAAIHMAWEFDPQHDPRAIRLKFHPPTGLLLVSGPSDAIDVVGNVLGNLKHTFPEQTKPVLPPPPSQ
jgi:hypothetical protein